MSDGMQNQLQAAGQALQETTSFVKNKKDLGLIIAVAVVIVGGIELIVRILDVPQWIFPPPSVIAVEMAKNITFILPHLGITLFEIICGYLIGATVGISLAILFTRWPILDKLFTPYILLLVATPMIALVPLLMLWLGFSPATKVIAVALGSFPVILINASLGLKRTDPKRIAVGKSLCASEGQIFRKIRFPSALPTIFTGLIIGGIFAIITAVGAEFAGGGAGLGNRILYYSALLNTPLVYGIVVLLAVMGVSLYLGISAIGARYTKWDG